MCYLHGKQVGANRIYCWHHGRLIDMHKEEDKFSDEDKYSDEELREWINNQLNNDESDNADLQRRVLVEQLGGAIMFTELMQRLAILLDKVESQLIKE